MEVLDATWKWTNTLQQVADGLTKLEATQALADVLKRDCHSLRFDPTYTAGKKLTKEERQHAQDYLENFAKARKKSSRAAHARQLTIAALKL